MRPGSELIALVYEAAIDPQCWSKFLDVYREALGARRAFLALNLDGNGKIALFCSSNWAEEDVQCYAEWYTADRGRMDGHIRVVDGFCRGGASDKSAAAPRGTRAFPHGLVGSFLPAASRPSTIVAVRAREDGRFDRRAVATLGRLMPHLRRAALIQRELSTLRVQLAVFTAYLNRHTYAFVLTDGQGRIIYANSAANEIAGLNDGITISSDRLLFMSNGDQAAFLRAVGAGSAAVGAPPRWLHVARPSHKPPYRLLLMPVPCSRAISPEFSQRLTAVLIIGTEPGPRLDPAILRVLFELTPTEARVTSRLGAGLSAEDIAGEMGLSLETVRTHIRRVLSKTSTGRQGELIALVLRTTPFHRL
jgi:DNA-binding CsgD family transcriptional regulator/PAS domain-containing protein